MVDRDRIYIYDSLRDSKAEFEPLKKDEVKLYVCGPTVYDEPHIGHARSAYVFELIRRYLIFKGFKVTFVRNITDVDDKIIEKARKEHPDTPVNEGFSKVALKYLGSYREMLKNLDIATSPEVFEPRASEYIEKIIDFITGLIERKAAYQSDGDVYFDITGVKDYGKLSNQSLQDMEAGARISANEKKKDPLDFALWKQAKENEPQWMSPWGRGRPGWHIECSVMSSDKLGDEFDIHGGGMDLKFPHHENEIAQSEAAGKKFARYWMHHGLVTINGQKMAKSLGNYITVDEILKQYDPNYLKIFFLQTHYRHPIDFSWEKLKEAKKAYEGIDILRNKILQQWGGFDAGSLVKQGTGRFKHYRDEFIYQMNDDFNMPKALAVVFKLVEDCNKFMDAPDVEFKPDILHYALTVLDELCGVFAIKPILKQEKEKDEEQEIKSLIAKRDDLKKNKEFKQADLIRDQLLTKGIILEDTKERTLWRRKL